MRPRPMLGSKAWYGPARGECSRSPASAEGHAVAVALVIIAFLKSTPPGGAREWKEFQARRDQGRQ